MKPALVMLSWRGGARLARCLASISPAIPHFSRVVLSSSSTTDAADMVTLRAFAEAHPGVEVICTGRELATMGHQRFWIEHLRRTGASLDDWVFWLAYDDEVRLNGLASVVGPTGDWSLDRRSAYLGPWALRHESPEFLWSGDATAPLESWTCLPLTSTSMPLLPWIAQQLRQPTYIQMSGSVMPLRAHAELVLQKPVKSGPMRIEMATALASSAKVVTEFPEPLTIVYGRSNSDRAAYGSAARAQDGDLVRRILRYVRRDERAARHLPGIVLSGLGAVLPGGGAPAEEWRVRGLVHP